MKKLHAGATDMTSGSPYRLLFLFTAPLLLGNVFQQPTIWWIALL